MYECEPPSPRDEWAPIAPGDRAPGRAAGLARGACDATRVVPRAPAADCAPRLCRSRGRARARAQRGARATTCSAEAHSSSARPPERWARATAAAPPRVQEVRPSRRLSRRPPPSSAVASRTWARALRPRRTCRAVRRACRAPVGSSSAQPGRGTYGATGAAHASLRAVSDQTSESVLCWCTYV